ncbi:Carboxyl-terminal-processing peptidase 2, chloroplastic [Ancistrocladus abbreviatus]
MLFRGPFPWRSSQPSGSILSLRPSVFPPFSQNPPPTSTLPLSRSCSGKYGQVQILEARLCKPLVAKTRHANSNLLSSSHAACTSHSFLQSIWIFHNWSSSYNALFPFSWRRKKYWAIFCRVIDRARKFKHLISAIFIRFLVGVMLLMSIAVAVSNSPALALSEENLLFLEAWRTIDRAYVDKTFNGQSWFRYRENALRNEPMNTREETYVAIRKMLATLDDPFTRFLEPEKFKSLRSGTQSSLTGVGLSIGYPAGLDGSSSGLVVISAAPGGPASRAGILSGDVILAIDDTSTESMGIYEAADQLQGPEGSSVKLTVRSGPEIKHVSLIRAKVALNPVKSRLCEIAGSGNPSRVGYIKLTSFTQNASGAVKEAIESLRSNNVNAFVLDLRDNSGGLFPEGIEIARIWLDKGVIVYICDSRGVRDIYDADGSNAIATSEPLAVLVNKGTASASEILAGALKDNKRAILFGEPTYGKGKIQSVFQLSDGSGLTVTVARYETPAHTDIDKVGVIPDHPLPATFPKDENDFCICLRDPSSACYLNRVELFAR